MKEELLTIQQAADFLSVSTKTLRRWEARGVLTPARTVGNQRRYTLTELQEFKAKGKPVFQTAPTANEVPGVSQADTQSIHTPVQNTPVEAQLHNSVNPQPFIPSSPFQTLPVQPLKQDVAAIPESYRPVQDQLTNVQDRVQVLQQHVARKKAHAFSSYAIVGLIIFTALLMATMYGPVKTASQLNLSKNSSGINVDKQSVLAAQSKGRNLIGDVLFNVPAIFEGKVTVENDFVVNGKSLFNEDVTVANKNVNLGTGKLTASNVVYGLTAGANITITGDPQNPTISAGLTGGIESFQGQSGVVTLVEGDGVGIDGLTITNTGVLSLAGETGDVELTAGDGIAIDGTTITNDDPGSAQNIFKTILVDATEIIAGSNDDIFTITAGSGITITPDADAKSITINSSVGSGLSGLTTYGVLYATSTTEATSTTDGTTGTVLKGVTGGAPVFGAVSLTADVSDVLPIANGGTGLGTTPSNGQLLIGNGTGYTLSTINGTMNQITINNSAGSIGISTPQDIHTGAMPTFATLNLTASANQLVLGTGNTATITTASLNNPRTYTLPNLSGEICLSSGNCSGSGGTLIGSGTTNYIPRFTSSSGIGDSSIYDDGKVAIGTASPQGLFNVIGSSTGKGLVMLNETGNQDILAGSSSGTTRFVFDGSGNLNVTGTGYQIGGVNVIASTGLGSTVVASSLTSVSTLDSGAISAGFGAIDTGTDAISGGNLTGTGATGLTLSGNGAGIVFSGTGTHSISASSGTMQLGALTLTGAVTGNGQNVTGVNNFSASGTIQFGGLGIGVVQSNGSGDISSAALNIGGGASYISGTLPTTNGGTGLTSYAAGDLIYASGANTLASRTIGTDGQVLTVSGGVPSWTDVSGSINFWQNINNAISPINSQNDVLIGSNATGSAKFAFKNVASGTPTASISAGTSGGVYLTAGGTLATTAKQSITLGSADSGNIVLNGFGTGIVKANASGVLSSSAINLAGTDVTGLLGVANGGTGAIDASGARTNLGAAASGANADITSLSGLTTALSVGQGGTGTTTLTSNGVLYGNGTGAIGATVAGTTGQLFLGQTGSAPSFQTLGGDATINASGVLAIGTDAVALGGDTTGNFVANISGGSGIGISGSAGEGWTPTVALAALTSDWDQTGAFDIVLNNAGSELRILESTGGSFYGTIDVGDLSGNQTYSFPATGGTICIVEAANCSGGGGGGVTTAGGITNRLTRFTGATAIGDASIDDLYTSGVAMTLDSTGRVGIGTASPLAQLHINGIATGGNAAVIVNQTAANDILTASASGVTRFVVNNNGNIQFGGNTSFLNTLTSLATQNRTYTLPDASGTICLTTGNCAGSGGGLTGSGTIGQIAYFDGAGTVTSDTTGFAWDGTNDRLGIGNDSPVAKLDLNGAVAGKALAIFNQTGDQDIFSASASGTTRLTLSNAGNLNLTSGSYQIGGTSVLNSTTLGSSVINSSLQTVGTIGTGTWQATAIGAQYGGTGDNTSGTTGVPYIAAGNWQYETQLSSARGGTSADLSGAAQGAIPYFSATGVMSALAPSTAGYVLSTNGAGQNPSWVATSSLGTNYWDSANGALSPKNAASMDLLLGATATSSAKFAFKNVSGGTPTASISAGLAGALYLTADGTIATTARQSLVLGTNTTGDIILNPNGNIAIGSATPGSDKLSVTGNTRVTGDVRSSNGFYQSGATDTVIGNDNSSSNIRFTTATGEKVRIGDSGNVGVGTTNLLGKFNVSGAASGKALAIFDETGDQNIIAGSASGVTRFTVDRSGNVNSIGGGYRVNGTTIIDSTANITNVGTINSTYLTTSTNLVNLGASTALQFNGTTVIDASRNLTNIAGVTTNLNPTANNTYSLGASGNQFSNVYGQTLYQNGNQVCDTSGNCAGQTTTYWNETNGALSPKNVTVDLLIGGATSDSAKFGVLNVSGGTPTASLSAGTNGGTFLTAAGTLQTTSGQTLYLGGGNTGNIVLNSGPGGIAIQDGVTLGGNLTQTGASSFTSGTGQVTLSGNVDAINGLDVTGAALNVGGSNASISLAGAIIGTQLDIDGSITINGNTISASTGDLTLSALDGNVFIANGTVLNGGGASGTSYNFFANSGETADQAAIQDDNDLYIGGSLEVDGTIYQGDNQVCDTSGNCNGGTNYFQINGDNISPGNAANDNDKLVLGGNTTTTHQFEVNGRQTGKALVSLNETGDQNILTGSASGTTAFTFDRSGNLTLSGDLQVGSIFLNAAGSNNVTSGASLIGVYDEFTNSNNTTLQEVLNDFDNALGAGSSKWTVSGNVIYPLTAGNQVGIGTTTAGDVVSSFYLTRDQAQGALGKSLAILNQTENQDIFTASAAGATRFTIANNGNLTATGTLTGLTGLSSSGTITLSSVTANRALFSDGSSNITGSGNSAALLNALTDETGTGVSVFDTSPSFTTSILTGSSSFDLLNTNASTINFGGAATTLTIGATSGTATIANTIVNLSNGALRTANIERLSNGGGLSNITGYSQTSGTFATTLSTTNTALFSSTTANSDSIAIAPNTTGSNTFTGTLTTADLTGNQTFTLPNASGTICVSGQSCAASGIVGYLTRTGTNLSPATATDTLSIGTTSPLATFDVRGLSGTSPIASLSGQTALAGLLVDNNGLGDIFTASKGGATKFTLLNNGNIRINNLANCTALETDATGLVNCGTDDLGTGGDGSSNWRIVNGAISPNNDTLDLLLGSSSSSSAKFAFMNINAGSGTPTASIAGTSNSALYLTGNGNIATTNKQSLSLGSASTGNVSLTGTRLQFTNLTGCDTIDTDANGFLTCGSDAGGAGGAGSINVQNNGSGVGTVDTIDFSSLFNVSTSPATTAHVTIDDDALNFSELSDTLALDNNPTSIAVNDYDLTLGTNAGVGGVIVSPNAGGKAALVVNKYGANDIFTASASGTTRFTIGNNGNLTATGTLTGLTGLTSSGTIRFSALTNAGGVLFTDGSGNVTQTAVGGSNQCLSGGATPSWVACDSPSNSYWQLNNGALAAGNNTYDLLIGGTSTESAKFAVTNIAGGTPTASISAQSGTNSALVLGANGTIQTVKNQTLTLGGSTTGNILLDEQTDLGSSTNGLRISTLGAISDLDGNISLNDNTDVTGNVDLSGTLTVGGSNEFSVSATGLITTTTDETINGIDINAGTVTDVDNLTINGGGTLTIGTTALNEITNPTDSGAYLIGVNDEFANSASTNVQAVLNDLDAAIGAGASKWTANSNVIYPTVSGAQVVLGGGTTTGHQFEVIGRQTGKTLVSLNETGDQNILTGSASGTTRFTFDRNGGLNLIGGNLQISNTNVIDSSRNLNNIGTIESTYLDASSNIVNLGASTDLQFNGTTVITAALNIQNISGIATDLVPTVDNTYDLGSNARRYAEIHGQAIYQAGNQVCDSSGNCAGTTNYLQLNSGTIAPGNAANAADRFVLGGNSTTTPFQFEVNGKQTGKALVSLNETGNQNILTGSASGATRFIFDNSGNLSLEGEISDISNNLVLNDTVDIGGANGIRIDTTGQIIDINGDIAISDNTNITGNVDLSGTLAVGGSNDFTVSATGVIATITDETINGIDINAGAISDVTGLTINGGGTVTIGTTALNETTGPTDSGAYLVGVNDEFDNSNSTNVQAVLNDLDAAIGAGSSKWTTSGNVVYPTTAGRQVGIGTTTAGSIISSFYVTRDLTQGALGKATAIINQTENQDIFAASASGTTRVVINNSGYLGLDTATPRSLFDLGTDGGIMTIGGLSSGGQINFGATGGANSVRFSNNELALYSSQSNGLKFYTNSDSDTATAELTIEDDGDIVFGSATYANCGMLTTSSNVVTCSSAPTGTNYWQTNSGTLAPGGSASVTDKLVLGGVSTTTSHQFEVNGKQTGKALVSLNETGDQNILVGSASGTTRFTFDGSGNLNLTGALQIGGQSVINASRQLQNVAGVATHLNPTAANTYDLGTGTGDQYREINGQLVYQNGNQVCDVSGNCSGLTTTYWDQNNGAISAKNATVDLLVGGTSTNSAKFAILNVAGNAPVASLSGATGGTSLSAVGTLQTTNNQTLTLGGGNTGNIVINSGAGGITLSDNTTLAGTFNQTGAGQVTLSGNVDATSGLDVTGASLTVGGSNASISVAGAIVGTQLDIDGILRLDSQTLSAQSGDLNLSAAGNNIVFADANTLIIGGHAGNVAYNVMSDSGGSPTSGQINSDDDLYVEGAIEAGAIYQGANQVCDTSGNCAGLTTTYWNQNNGAISAKNSTVDLLVGGVSSSAAKFAVLGMNGSATPYASVSAIANGNGISIGGDGTIQSFRKNTLTLGGSSTGNIIIDSGSGNIALSDNTTLAGTFNQTGAGQVTLSGNVDATSGLDVTGASLTVGGTASITTAGVIAGTQLDIDGILRLDSQTLSAQSGDLNLSAAGDNIVFADADTLIIGGHAGNVAYNVISDSGSTSQSLNSDDDLFVEGSVEVDGTFFADGGITLTGGTISDGTDGVDINDSLEIADNTTLGDANTDTITFNAEVAQDSDLVPDTLTGTNDLGSSSVPWDNLYATSITQNGTTLGATYAPINANFITVTANGTLTGETGIDNLTTAISTTNNLNVDGTTTLGGTTIDANQNLILAAGTGKLGIGNASPVGKLDLSGAVTGKALTILNETGDQNILVGSTSGTTRFTFDGSGNLNLTGALQIGGQSVINASRQLQNVAGVGTDLIPTANNTYDLGSGSNRYAEIHGQTIYQAGNQVCDTGGNCSGLTTTYWDQNNGAISAKNSTVDLLVGGVSTSAAKFAVLGMNSGTPVASISGGLNGNGAFLSSNGTLATTRKQTLSLGDANTGNIVIDSGSGNIALSDNTTLAGTFNQTGAGQVTFSGNVDATSGLDVTGASLTVGGTATISTGGNISGNQLDIDGTIRLDGTTLSTLSNDLTLDANGNNIVFADTDTLIIGNHAGNVAYNVISDAGGAPTSGAINSDDDLYVEGAIEASALYQGANQVCDTSGNCAGLTTTYWNQNNGAISAKNATVDLLVGGVSTSAAKFAVLGMNSGTPVASISGGLNGNGAFLSSNGTLATTRKQTLSLGDANTGNIVIDSGSGNISLADNTSLTGTFNQTGAGQVTLSGNVDATSGLDVTGASLTVGGSNASISVAGAIVGTQLDIDGILRLDTQTLSAQSGDLNFSAAGSNIVFADANTLIIGNHAGNVAYNVISDAGGSPTSGQINSDDDLYVEGAIEAGALYQGANQVCDTGGNCSGLTTTYWNQANGAISAKNSTVDLLVGGVSSSAAKFAVLNVNNGIPTASISGGLNGNGAFLSSNGTLATTRKQTLSLGDANTGNIIIDSGTGNIALSDNTTLAGTFNQTGAGQVTLSGNVDATSGIDVTGASLTVGGSNASITTAGVIAGTQLDIDGILRLDSQTLSTLSNDLTLDANGNNIVFADADTLIIGNHAGNVAYNVISDAGGSPTSGQINSDDDLYVEGTIEASALYQGANQVCDTSNNCGSLTTTYWNQNNGAISAKNSTVDLLVGGVSSSAAKFAVLGVNGSATPYASVSATSNGNGISMGGDGTIQSFRKNTLTLGGASTGNIAISPNGGSGILTVNAPTLNLNGTTSITGGSTGISFTNFTVNSSTGAVNIAGAGGTLTVEGTVLDTDSLTFTGTGLIATQGSTNLTLAPATGYVRVGDTATPGSATGDDDLFVEGDVELNGILYADSNVQIGGTTITASSLTTMSTAALSLNATGDLTLDSTTDIILDADGADIFLRDAGAAFAQFTNSTTDLTLDVAGGQFILANADVLNIGGLTGVAYNAISDSGATNRGLASDNDLFVEGDVEVNGTMYLDGAVSVNGVTGADVTASCVTTDNGIVTAATSCTGPANTWTANTTTGVLHTSNQTMDVLIGGTSSISAAMKLSANNRGPVASISANTGFAAMVVNNNSTGDLFTASKSGKTHFTIRNSGAVVIGNTTDGITFDVNNPNVVYSGNARLSRSIVLSAEYPGAALTASVSAGTNHTGYMTSDASASAALSNFMNYYEWSTDSTQGTLQDYTVAVRVTLPQDFGGWTTSNAITINYNTELGGANAGGSNKLDVLIYNATTGLSAIPVAYYQGQFNSSAAKTWTQLTIDDSDLTNGTEAWDTFGETAVIYLRMYSRHANHVQVGDITLNYLGRN